MANEFQKRRRDLYYNVGRKLYKTNFELFKELCQIDTISDINQIGYFYNRFSKYQNDSNSKRGQVSNRRVFIYVILMLMDKDVLICNKSTKRGLSIKLAEILSVHKSIISTNITELRGQLKFYPKFTLECESMYQKIKSDYETRNNKPFEA